MKKLLFLALIGLSACNEKDHIVIGDLKELDGRFHTLDFSNQENIEVFEGFFEEFLIEGEAHAEKNPKPQWEKIHFAVDNTGWLKENHLRGVFVHLYMKEKYIVVESDYWAIHESQGIERVNAKIRQRRNLIFHELGHAVLNRDHVNFWSVMLPTTQDHMVLDFELLYELFNFSE
jgi:hypothetical protein